MIPDPIGEAVRWVGEGGLLAYPTETVWGLGASAVSEEGLARLRVWKRRSERQPVTVLVEDCETARALGFELDEAALALAAAFWPGPLTLVVPCRLRLAPGVAREDGAVGVRCSSHPLAAALARRLRREGVGPITSTSLNRAGLPPARSVDEATPLCDRHPDLPRMIDVGGAESGGDLSSTVVDTTGPVPQVLRWGALRRDELGPLLESLGGE